MTTTMCLSLILASVAASAIGDGEAGPAAPASESGLPLTLGPDGFQEKQESPLRSGSFPGSILLPGSDISLKLGGQIKVDAIHDFDAIGTTDEFKTSSIPVPEVDSDGNTDFHALGADLRVDLITRTLT